MEQRPIKLEIITPSYAPDFELCRDLVESVARFAPAGTIHRVIVPRRDLRRFERLRSGSVVIEDVRSLLPSSMVKIPLMNAWLRLDRPSPPVRGWIAQQIVKLGAAATSRADRVLLVDSDVVFIRPFSVADFGGEQAIPLYRLDDAVHDGMPRHVLWDDAARDLLGLPSHRGRATRPDYICWPCMWSPAVVRAMLARVEARSGRSWQGEVGRRLHFSEMVLYGVYVDAVVAGRERVAHQTDMRCANHHLETPLDQTGIRQLLDGVAPTDVAVMVSAKSGTALSTRRAALARFQRGS